MRAPIPAGVAAAMAALFIAPVSGAAEAAPDTKKLEHAYVVAQDCYVTYTYGKSPDKASKALKASQTVGRILGKSDARIAEDMASANATTRGDFSRNSTAYARSRKECAEVGL